MVLLALERREIAQDSAYVGGHPPLTTFYVQRAIKDVCAIGRHVNVQDGPQAESVLRGDLSGC